ncbi:exodeoxyribonuclease V subunit gamma [Desulfofustis glycolicus]|uniref:DNA helicase/exodeoxyribonuclease V, gamma subunit n=1 Tax=Desulfofustis glycolicus DSM 9705 TaxID=1121409 RepID=A0A1M5VUL1_9BACT|nr:exodeoxyribonuclease V subunit gamma [Desulfofustis glycolicus]SHH78952.1 DNA helicase/exodeoxyribonuclease V, gamma subunit [Desulfofustis glycolicus DSM 9705]
MFYLYTSNRTERLADRLAAVIAEHDPPSLFQPELFLVQNRGMERLLCHALADSFGVWCHGRFLLPVQFFDELCRRWDCPAEHQSFDRDLLVWRLERLLRDLDDESLIPLRVYLDDDGVPLKRYQLAVRLAAVFDQYQIMRPDLLAAWERGESVFGGSVEAWQRRLWTVLRRDDPAAQHRGETMLNLAQTVRDGELNGAGPTRVFVFGMHTLPPLFLGVLEALAGRIDVHFFLLSPCRQYWGDIESRRSRVLHGGGEFIGTEGDGGFGGATYHPLLAGFGRQGAHFQELLLDMVEGYQDHDDDFVDPAAGGGVLHRLQSDLLDGREAPLSGDCPKVAEDGSLQVVSCHSRWREIVVLKDFLLSRLYGDPDLQLHDIVVMAPDIDDYAHLIPAVYGDLAHDVSDGRIRRENRVIDGFLQFLQLFGGHYGWSELLGVLERPEVYPRFFLTAGDLDLLRFWVVDCGIRWGLSAEQRRDDGLYPFTPAAWRTGLERLLMGVTVAGEEPVDGILPYSDIEGSQAELLGGLCRFVDLVERGRHVFQSELPLASWAQRLRGWCDELFVDTDQPDLLELLQLIDALEQRYAPHHDQPVVGTVVRQWLEAMADGRSSAGFISGRLTFCSMLPMRSVPFKIICLIGLNDGDFPRTDQRISFDLMTNDYRKGDRVRREDDRYQFLEAILAAREVLYLSYVGQSVRTNKPVPPSVVLAELLDVLQHSYGVADLVRAHPLHAYDRSYFTDECDLFSYDDEQYRLAATLEESGDRAGSPWLTEPLPVELPQRLELAELARFFRAPQRYLARSVLGIRFDALQTLPDEHEPFELTGLDRYQADHVVVDALLRKQPPEIVLRILQDRQAWPLGTPGELAFTRRLDEIRPFADEIAAAGGAVAQPSVPVELTIGARVLAGELTNRCGDGLLFYRYANLRGRDILGAWLYHLVAAQVLAEPVTTRILCRNARLTIGAWRGGPDDLAGLLELYVSGCRVPSSLLLEPALAYARQVVSNRGRGRKDPLEKARETFRQDMRQGFEPAYRFFFRDTPSEDVLGDDFVACCENLMVPLWDAILADSEEHVR